jgi:cobalt/nickel transport system permease protein
MTGHLHMRNVLSRERAVAAHRRRGAFLWNAQFKLLLVLAAAALNVGLAISAVSGALLTLGVVMLAWSRPPWRSTAIFLLIPLWPTLVTLAGFAIGFGVTPVATLGRLTFYREGLLLGAAVVLRIWCDIVWLAALVLTTPFSELLQALRWLRVPAILVDTLAMMYRYAFFLHEEFVRMRTAGQSRGGWCGTARIVRTIGRITAQIFMRAFDRSERISCAMFARGGQ